MTYAVPKEKCLYPPKPLPSLLYGKEERCPEDEFEEIDLNGGLTNSQFDQVTVNVGTNGSKSDVAEQSDQLFSTTEWET